jgi:hypothetical protein
VDGGSFRFNVVSAASAFSGPSQASARTASPAGFGQGQLPARSVPQFDDLLAEVHLSAAPGGQIDRADRHLRRQAKRVGRRRPVRDDDSRPLGGEGLDSLLDRGRPRAEPAGDGTQIDAATGPDELPRSVRRDKA